MMTQLHQPLLLIGGGTMGRAIVEGAVRAGVLVGGQIVVHDPDPARHAPFEALGAACTTSLAEALDRLDALDANLRTTSAAASAEDANTGGMILLAVKPQVLGAVAEAMHAAAGPSGKVRSRLVMSILAGTPTSRLAEAFGGLGGPALRAGLGGDGGDGVGGVGGGRIVRLMPNTPAQIGKGITALCPGPGATPADITTARQLFAGVGRVVDLPEDLLDAFTGVAGSGPAYVFLLAEGMLAGAEAVGFDREQGLELVRATITGAAALLNATNTDPATLRALVTSKGGTTAAATGVLIERGVPDALCDAIVAARDRGRELADG